MHVPLRRCRYFIFCRQLHSLVELFNFGPPQPDVTVVNNNPLIWALVAVTSIETKSFCFNLLDVLGFNPVAIRISTNQH